MDYTMPDSHLGLLQAIVEELVRARDPEATFIAASVVREAEKEES